jgi:hypothetical protein
VQLAATIAVVVSVLVLALQARELAKQSRISNQVAAVQADRDVVSLMARTSDVFIRYPELRGDFFDQEPQLSSHADPRLKTIADQHADMLETLIDTTRKLGPYTFKQEEALAFASDTVASSSHLRAMIRENPGWWPPLEQLVASYDSAHDTSAQEAASVEGTDAAHGS